MGFWTVALCLQPSVDEGFDHVAVDDVGADDDGEDGGHDHEGAGLRLLHKAHERRHDERAKHGAEHAKEQHGAGADIAVNVAPVPDLDIVIPQAHAHPVVQHPAGHVLDDARADHGQHEQHRGVELLFRHDEEEPQRAEGIDRQPRSEAVAAFDKIP